MAIKTFSSSNTTDLTRFYNFLQANKAGTFLENMTIELSNNTIKITGTNAVLTINGSATGQTTFASYVGKYYTSNIAVDEYNSSYNVYITGALLCKNGILFQMYGQTGSSTWATRYTALGITVDSNGELAIIRYSRILSYSSDNNRFNTYRTDTYNSTNAGGTTVSPQFNSPFTSLAPIVPTCDDNSITLPYAYAALHSQVNALGLCGVTIDGTNYITNGSWYIKDE